MSLNAIQNTILRPFINESLGNLSLMAGMQGRVEDGFTDTVEQFRFKGYAVCAETRGSIEGVMLMHHYIETAVAMGNAIRKNVLGIDEACDTVTNALADALAEWGNTVIGRATKMLSDSHLNITFEPPYFVFDTDTMSSLMTGVTDIITVPVHVDQVGRFYFNYLIREISPEVNDSIVDAKQISSYADHCIVMDNQRHATLEEDKKILIVDDMKMVRTSMKRYLKKLGYHNIVEAENGKDAVIKQNSEKPDFMFMDVVMPELNGNEALREIRKQNTDIPIVMLTSVADQSIIDECESLGIAGYIIKPLTMETGPDVLAKFLLQ